MRLLMKTLMILAVFRACFVPSAFAGNLPDPDISVDTSVYEDSLKNLSTDMTPDPEMLEKARKSLKPGLQERVDRERDRLLDEVFSGTEKIIEYNRDKGPATAGKNAVAGRERKVLPPGERIYVLVSSSVPLETLRNYARDMDALAEPGLYMVMRGFVGGASKIRPTIEFVRKILLKDRDCQGLDCETRAVRLDIDPRPFRKYGAEAVPAVVYESGRGDAYVLYGDLPLEDALERINRRARSAGLECLAMKLRLGPYRGCGQAVH